MKNKIILLLAFLCLCFSQAESQNQSLRMTNEIFLGSKSNVMNENKSSSTKSKTKLIEKDSLGLKSSESKLDIAKLKSISKHGGQKEDTLYCTEIVRRNSWIVGIGDTLTQEDALKRSTYFRLSMKNEHGHWQHIETMSKSEKKSSYKPMCYYDGIEINDVDDYLLTSINEISQWFEFSDLEGKDLLEERAYDAEGNLILTGMFHKHEDGRIIVCYNDSHGFPVDFKPDDGYTYGHVFAITYNDKGKDYIVECYDGAGYSRLNAFGCYQYRNIYDNRDYFLEKTCHNSVGHLMNNKFGFARRTYDVSADEKHNIRKHYDVDGNLVKPDMPVYLMSYMGYMIEELEYDDDGEVKSWRYFIEKDGERENDEVDGVHCYVFEKDENDGTIIYKCYDKNFNEVNR